MIANRAIIHGKKSSSFMTSFAPKDNFVTSIPSWLNDSITSAKKDLAVHKASEAKLLTELEKVRTNIYKAETVLKKLDELTLEMDRGFPPKSQVAFLPQAN